MIKITDINDYASLLYEKKQEKWFVENSKNNRLYDLSDDNNLISALIILYKNPDDFWKELHNAVIKYDLPKDALDRFPLKKIIVFCLKSGMFFWVELSIKWIRYIDVDQEFFELALEYSKQSKIDQHLRHSFLKAVQEIKHKK